jgi:hypothetical protein
MSTDKKRSSLYTEYKDGKLINIYDDEYHFSLGSRFHSNSVAFDLTIYDSSKESIVESGYVINAKREWGHRKGRKILKTISLDLYEVDFNENKSRPFTYCKHDFVLDGHCHIIDGELYIDRDSAQIEISCSDLKIIDIAMLNIYTAFRDNKL